MNYDKLKDYFNMLDEDTKKSVYELVENLAELEKRTRDQQKKENIDKKPYY